MTVLSCPPILTIRRVLLSVSDKTHLLELATFLSESNIEILSTGGTAKLLQEHHIPVIEVADYTGSPEILDGRVKTLHPKIHGGILDRGVSDHDTLTEHDILPIDLVVVNLYPFKSKNSIENIDIGGPTMIRAAAKNYAFKAIVVDPNDYLSIIEEIQLQQGITELKRLELATKAFAHTADYDAAIAEYFTEQKPNSPSLPSSLHNHWSLKQALPYGENPHQDAALYTQDDGYGGLASARQIQGKPLSYNNLADADAAWRCVKSFDATIPACTIVKHANPCGVAVASTLKQAYLNAYTTDPQSSFGGIIAFNHSVDADTLQAIIKQQFVEVILAPAFEAAAIELATTKPRVRLLACERNHAKASNTFQYKAIDGGLLVQQIDNKNITIDDLTIVTQRQPSAQELKNLIFAWRVVKHVKSNAIVYAKNNATIAIGAGQMSRVFSAEIAALKAEQADLTLIDAAIASDAFFPFADSIEIAAHHGITAIIQPGGSIRDKEVIAAADAANMAMVFTGVRHFLH